MGEEEVAHEGRKASLIHDQYMRGERIPKPGVPLPEKQPTNEEVAKAVQQKVAVSVQDILIPGPHLKGFMALTGRATGKLVELLNLIWMHVSHCVSCLAQIFSYQLNSRRVSISTPKLLGKEDQLAFLTHHITHDLIPSLPSCFACFAMLVA